MGALCRHGKEDIRCDRVPDPVIEHPHDALDLATLATGLDEQNPRKGNVAIALADGAFASLMVRVG